MFEEFYTNYELQSGQGPKRKDIIYKIVGEEYSYAMVNYVSSTKDISLFICYDHRKNKDLTKISKFLIDDIRSEEKNCFITRVVE